MMHAQSSNAGAPEVLSDARRKPHARSWIRTCVFRFVLVLFSIGLALAAVEVGFRLFVPVTDVPFMFWDPFIGPRRIPNQTGNYIFKEHVRGRYRINPQGWNNLHDYVTSKSTGAKRVCVVGDSFTEAIQVPVEKTFFSVAEKLMNRPDRPVEWYSFANSGLGTTHEYLLIRHYALDYHPDVVVMLFVTNDPVDCSPYLSPQETWMGKTVLGENGTLEYTPPLQYVPSALNRFLAKFALVRYLKIQRGMFGASVAAHQGQSSVREGAGRGQEDLVARGLTLEEKVERTWQLIGAVLKQAKEDCANRDAVFVVAFMGHRWEIEAAAEGKTYQSPDVSVDPYCLNERINDMGRQYLEPLCQKLDIPYLDLTAALISKVKETGKRHNFEEDSHYAEVGHAGAGEALAKWIEGLWAGGGKR